MCKSSKLLWLVVCTTALLATGFARAATVTVNMSGFQFDPKNQTINVGDTVTWVNREGVQHDTTSGVNRTPNGIWHSPLLGNGGSFSFTFNNAGTFPYYCTPHALPPFNMVGTITVVAPNAPPTVNITNPPGGATFIEGATVLIEANASDDNGVARVEFFANGNPIGTDFNAPFSATLNNAVAGNYSLTAKAFDAPGLSATSAAVNISVREATTAPVIISQPQSQSVLPGSTVMFSVTASGTPPLSYQWRFNGTNISGATTDSLSLSNVRTNHTGSYSVLVSNEVDSISSAIAILTVTSLPNIPPTISLISPANGTQFRAGSLVEFQAHPEDSDGMISQVEFVLGTNSIAVLTNAPYGIVLSNLAAGNYLLTAKVTDDASGTNSAEASFSVLLPPGIQIVSPQDNSRHFLGMDIDLNAAVIDTGLCTKQVQFFELIDSGLLAISPPLTNTPYLSGWICPETQGPTNLPGPLPWNYHFAWNSAPLGTHTLVAIVTDRLDGTNSSASVHIEIIERGTQNPTIAITDSPASLSRLNNTPVAISGTANDDILLARVEFQVNDGSFLSASGTTNWTAQIDLMPGINVVNIRSVDLAGHFSTNATRTFHYVPNLLRVQVHSQGTGKVLPNLDGKLLEIGKTYQMVARPASGFIFGGWTGGITSSLAILNLTMQSGLDLIANFTTNPFPAVKGNYSGLIFATNGIKLESSGFIKLNVTRAGKFSGKLTIAERIFSVHGQFDYAGKMTLPVLRRPMRPVVLALILNLQGPKTISGSVTDGEWVSQLSAEPVAPLARANPVSGGKSAFNLMNGDQSFGTALIRPDKTSTINAKFSAGESATKTFGPSVSGATPVYISSHKGSAVLLGWLYFTNGPAASLDKHLFLGTTDKDPAIIELFPQDKGFTKHP